MDCDKLKEENGLDYDPFASIDLLKMEEEARPFDTPSVFEDFELQENTFRTRCNTWPRHQLQPDLLQVNVDPESCSEFGKPQSVRNLAQHANFGRILPPVSGAPWCSKLSPQGLSSSCSPPSGTPGILPLVSEEEPIEVLSSIFKQESNSLDFDLMSPSASSMDTGSPNVSSGLPEEASMASPCADLSPKPKNTTRRNPWGNMSYADLITQAIKSSPEQRLTLAQIYEWLIKTVPYFKEKGDSISSIGWKNSIRHNLSLHSRFVRVQNEGSGKSSWWTLNPDASKQSPSNQATKHPRRRANTLESGTLQHLRTGRRGRGVNGSVGRRRDSSNSSRATPVLGPRSETPLERAGSSHSIFNPDSPPVYVRHQGSPEYNPLNAGPSFAGPIRCRTLSNASSCTGGRLSPFRPRTSSAYSLDGSQTTTTSPSAWLCQSPPPYNMAEEVRINETSDDGINLTQSDLDAIKSLDLNFVAPDMLLALNKNDFGREDTFKDQSHQPQTSNVITTNNSSLSFGTQPPNKTGLRLKILEPRESSPFDRNSSTMYSNYFNASTQPTKIFHATSQVNPQQSNATISAADIRDFNLDLLFTDKMTTDNSVSLDDLLKTDVDFNGSVDLISINQHQFTGNLDFFNKAVSSSSNTANFYPNSITPTSSSSASAVTLETF